MENKRKRLYYFLDGPSNMACYNSFLFRPKVYKINYYQGFYPKQTIYWEEDSFLLDWDPPCGNYRRKRQSIRKFRKLHADILIIYSPELIISGCTQKIKDNDKRKRRVLQLEQQIDPDLDPSPRELVVKWIRNQLKCVYKPLTSVKEFIYFPIILRPLKKLKSLEIFSKVPVILAKNLITLSRLEMLKINCPIPEGYTNPSENLEFNWEDLEKLHSLKGINLANIHFSHFKFSPSFAPPPFEIVRLTNASLTKVPEWVFRLPHLKALDLSSNNLSSLKSISRITTLVWLRVEKNNLTSLDGIEQLERLESLYMNHNHLKSMKSLNSLRNLVTLDLAYNEITDVDESVLFLPKLSQLFLQHNKISYFSLEWWEFTQEYYYIINISHNQIPTYEEVRPLELLCQYSYGKVLFPQRFFSMYPPKLSLDDCEKFDHDEILQNLPATVQHFFKTKNYEMIPQYYQDPIETIVNKLKNDAPLTPWETERIIHEFSFCFDRQILELILPADHAILQTITHNRQIYSMDGLSLPIFL